MDDDKFKALFAGYNPDMQSDDEFMERLHRNLNAIESVKKNVKEAHRRNLLAVIAAAITGFVSGIVLTLCYPYISEYTNDLVSLNPTLALLQPGYIHITPFIIICLATTVLSYSAYDLTLSLANILRQSK